MRRLEHGGRPADRWLQRSNWASSGLLQIRKTRSRIDPTPRIPPSGTADLVEPASLLVLYAPNLYRDIVQELKKGVDWLDQKALFESGH